MILNLVGTTGSGKTTLARRWVAEHPGWQLLQIDLLRDQCRNEDVAWLRLRAGVVRAAKTGVDTIVESSGVSRHLREIITHQDVWRQLFTVALTVRGYTAQARIASRATRHWFAYSSLDITHSVEWIATNLQRRCPCSIDRFVDTDCSLDEAYRRFELAMPHAEQQATAGQP